MPLTALGLVILAAVMHACWNFVLKQATHKPVFLWCGVIIGTCFFGTLCLIAGPVIGLSFSLKKAWPYMLASAVMEVFYYLALTRAYDIDDFSLIYPIARGTAPVLLLFWSTVFLGEWPSRTGLLGIAILVVGLVIVGSGTLWTRWRREMFSVKGIVAALVAAACISIYSVIDGAAVRVVSAIPYTVLMLGLSALLATPAITHYYGMNGLVKEFRMNWRRIWFVGIFMLLTYILVLLAYSMARVSYSGAIREVSIVFAALMGWLWLGEGFGLVRTLGSFCIFAGIVVIAIFG